MKKAKATAKEIEDDPLAEDLTGYLSTLKWRKSHFKFAPKDATMTIRMSKSLVDMVKKVAKKKGVKYNRMVRDVIADYVVKAA
jgi:predicted DNA binding CopG/RHH family protein